MKIIAFDFCSFQLWDIAQADKHFSLSVTFLLSFKKLTWVHLPPFCLPFDNEGYHALSGFIFLKCHLAVISMTACFIQRPIKPLEKTQERISACERQSWGREGTEGFLLCISCRKKKIKILLFPLGVYLMIGTTCNTFIITWIAQLFNPSET